MKVIFIHLVFAVFIIHPLLFAQVPEFQDTIFINGGTLDGGENAGMLETIINGDTVVSGTEKGQRINPNRVYALNEGQIYFQLSELKVNNPTGALTIVGVPSKYGTEKPIILIVPTHGMPILSNEVYGSIKLVNIHYQSQQLDGTQNNELFYCGTKNKLPQSLTIDNCLFEFCNIDLFDCTNEQGGIGGWPNGAKFFITNSYFRNMFYYGQWWGSRVFQCKHPIDTLWVENCTVTTAGLTFLEQNALIDFAYFNHNTIVNNNKYWLLSPFYKTFYVTNNIFINQNWTGEDTNTVTWPDTLFHSTINIDTVTPGSGLLVQQKYYAGDSAHYTDVLSPKNMKVFISNNINYYNSLLINGYYLSPTYINDTVGTPPSYLTYAGYGRGPWKIENIPCEWMNSRTKDLFAKFLPPNGGFIEKNTIAADPQTLTSGIADENVVTVMAEWNQNQWDDPRFKNHPYDILNSKYIYGDYDPSTLPGITNGMKTDKIIKDSTGIQVGITKFTDLSENFNQSVYISTIDNLPIGSLIWDDNQKNNFNSADDWQKIQEAYNKAVDVDDKIPGMPVSYKLFQNYPNPFNPTTTIQFTLTQSDNVILIVYNILGQKVATLVNENMKAGFHKVNFNASSLSSGVYVYKLQAGSFTSARKMMVLK